MLKEIRKVTITAEGKTRSFIELNDGTVSIDGMPGVSYTSEQLTKAIEAAETKGYIISITDNK